jgi:hypothetical protein
MTDMKDESKTPPQSPDNAAESELSELTGYVVQRRWPKKGHIPKAWQEWHDVRRSELDARAFDGDRKQLEFYVRRKMDEGSAQYRIVKRTDKELTLFIT